MGAIDEQQLIDAAKRGNMAAVEDLVRRYQDLAFRVAFLITRDEEEARDAAQTGFIKAYRAIGKFREGAPFRSWLLQIVANEAKNRRAAAVRHPAVPLSDVEELPIISSEPSPEEEAERAEERQTVLAALDKLRDEDRQVISYRYFLDLSEAEIAGALNCPKGTVKSRLSRAMSRLRETISQEPGLAGGGQIHD